MYTYLPCGRKVRAGVECCKTVCPDKSNAMIEICYGIKARKLKKKLGVGKLNKLSWGNVRDAYFECGGRGV